MQLPDIFLLAFLLILLRLIPVSGIRSRALLVCSCVFIFYFQPVLPVRGLDFNLPLWTILLTICVYGAFSRQNPLKSRRNLTDAAIIFVTLLLISATRYISYDGILTPSRPPQLIRILPIIITGAALAILLNAMTRREKKWPSYLCISVILAALVILKMPAFSLFFSRLIRSANGQDTNLAAGTDLRWFGFSYISFRLLSILIDTLKGRKTDLSLGDFLVYACFPPALSAGPIDRWDRFSKEFSSGSGSRFEDDLISGFGSVALGLFHKFILADALAKMSFSAQNAPQFVHTGWAWAALFAYSLQIYFDFCGYSEIAVGLGTLYCIRLPKNFNHPYLKPDLTKFWSSWHMTLTQWIRSYVFNPLTRRLRQNKDHPLPQWLIILITQLTTMLIIGLWHGISWNFIIWGLWHGIGLFIHQLYGRKTGNRIRELRGTLQKTYTLYSTLLTILYVSLGWIWFVTPDFSTAIGFFGRLFG